MLLMLRMLRIKYRMYKSKQQSKKGNYQNSLK